MRLAQWIAGFKDLHDRSKKGALSAEERKAYLAAREELARALLAAQRVQAKPGQTHRQALRVSRALQANLAFGDDEVRTMTLDLSAAGFGSILAKARAIGEVASATLRLPGGEQLSGKARLVGFVPQAGSVRAAFTFDPPLGSEDAERLELLVFDTVLDQIKLEPEKK